MSKTAGQKVMHCAAVSTPECMADQCLNGDCSWALATGTRAIADMMKSLAQHGNQ
jgi:hypothetical protein